MNSLMIFEGKKVEVFEFKGQILFNPYHVGDCLGIKNIRDSIRGFNKNQVVKLTKSTVGLTDNLVIPTSGKNFLTESGVYKLIFKSRKKEAEKFADWVTDEVLPAIRKTGKYEQPKQLQIEEPYQVVKKTLHGKPVMTIRDIVHLTGESKQAIYWNTVHRNVAYQLLEGKELEEFKKENNLKHFWNSLIVLPREGVSRLFTVLGKSQDQVEEYFGKEKPSIKDLFKVREMEILRRLNRTLFISVEFRKQLDLLLSMEYVQLGLLEKPTTDLGVSTSAGWNLNGDVMEFYSQFM